MADNYSILTDGEMRGLTEARASGVEVIAYMALTRYHNDPEHPARCWKAAQLAEKETGISADVFRKALNSLTRKTFTEGGEEITVLARISRGHNGRAAVYNDNLFAIRVLNDKRQVAGMIQPATVFNNLNSSRNDYSTYYDETDGVAGTIRPSSRNDYSTQIKEPIADALLPAAELSIGVSQPHKRETRERLQVATGTETARANGAAPRGRAIALPSWQEVLAGASTEPEPAPEPVHVPEPTAADEARYFELLRKVQDHMATGGAYDEALTTDEREEYDEISARRRAHAMA